MSRSNKELYLRRFEVQDSSGRPFDLFYSHAPREFVPNTIAGREGYMTDINALAEFAQNRKNVEKLISLFRSTYQQSVLAIGDVYDMSVGISFLPLYVSLRKRAPIDKEHIPPSLIDASRTALGIYQVALAIIASGVGEQEYVSPTSILDFAGGKNSEGRNFFVQSGEKTQSCPAPFGMVKQILDHMVYSSSSGDGCGTDWAAYIDEKDAHRAIAFGKGLVVFNYCVDQCYMLSPDSPERKKYEVTIDSFHIQLNSALGYTD